MALYPLLFGHAPGPPEPRRARPQLEGEREPVASEPLTVRVPAALKGRVEASAALEGVSPGAWIARALARSVDPRVVAR